MNNSTLSPTPTVPPTAVPPPILRLPAGYRVCPRCNGAGADWRGICHCDKTGIEPIFPRKLAA
jgi:hypothetical protein